MVIPRRSSRAAPDIEPTGYNRQTLLLRTSSMALLRGRSRLRSLPALAGPSTFAALLLAGAAAVTIALVPARAASPGSRDQPQGSRGTVRLVPAELKDESWLERRRADQARTVQGVSAFHDFQFTD